MKALEFDFRGMPPFGRMKIRMRGLEMGASRGFEYMGGAIRREAHSGMQPLGPVAVRPPFPEMPDRVLGELQTAARFDERAAQILDLGRHPRGLALLRAHPDRSEMEAHAAFGEIRDAPVDLGTKTRSGRRRVKAQLGMDLKKRSGIVPTATHEIVELRKGMIEKGTGFHGGQIDFEKNGDSLRAERGPASRARNMARLRLFLEGSVDSGGRMEPDFEESVRTSLARQTMMTTIGAAMTRVGRGTVEIELPFAPHILQQHGFVHDGAVGMIADSACGFAALTVMPSNRAVLTTEFKINFMAPPPGSGSSRKGASSARGER